jgi:DNA replication ATP-dependent helicase Dna2
LDAVGHRKRFFDLTEMVLISVDQFMHVVADFDPFTRTAIVDENRGYAVVNPDILISGTVIADSLSCMRKSVLADRIRFPTDRTMALLNGSMSHEFFQQCLAKNDFSTQFMESIIPGVIKSHMEDLYAVDETETAAIGHLRESIPGYQAWSQMFLGPAPKVSASHEYSR